MSSKSTDQSSPEFASYYLQRTTQELSEDLDKVRNAEDFKADSIPFLVHALQQGTGLFSPEDQKRVVAEPKAKDGDAWGECACSFPNTAVNGTRPLSEA